MLTLTEVEAEVVRRAAVIRARGRDLLPTFGYSCDFARPHIDVDATGDHLIVIERGREDSRLTTCDLDELLYHVFDGITSQMAGKYELAHRIDGEDFRRLWFRRQVELLAMLSDAWARRQAAEHEATLRDHPFADGAD